MTDVARSATLARKVLPARTNPWPDADLRTCPTMGLPASFAISAGVSSSLIIDLRSFD